MGKYIFEIPHSSDYHASFHIEPLWETFGVLQLLTNHRQGEDYHYAEILNRIRAGQQTDEDYEILQQRVRPVNHPDIPPNAIHVTALNKHVNMINEFRIEKMDGVMHEISAIVQSSAQKEVNAKTSSDGSIFNTPLQKILKLKVGARIMLTYNVDVIDSLTNGAFGEVVGFQFTVTGSIKTVLIQFDNHKVGFNRRKNYGYFAQQYPDKQVTPIDKIEFNFSMSKKQTNNQIMTATQFPLKLSFACTAHKMQGATVTKPNQLVLDLRYVMEPAQAYVMLSRVQAIDQLFIIETIPKKKINPSPSAIQELERLMLHSNNNKEMQIRASTVVISLNIRSLSKHFLDLQNDFKIMQSNIICLQETWNSAFTDIKTLQIFGFNLHLINRGKGKGIATYYKNIFKPLQEINTEKFQMASFSSDFYNVINVYRSQGADTPLFIQNLSIIMYDLKNCIIVGDLNLDYLTTSHPIIEFILSCGFKQHVKYATHEDGGLLDYAFVRSDLNHGIDLHWPYYSDHAAICVVGLVC